MLKKLTYRFRLNHRQYEIEPAKIREVSCWERLDHIFYSIKIKNKKAITTKISKTDKEAVNQFIHKLKMILTYTLKEKKHVYNKANKSY